MNTGVQHWSGLIRLKIQNHHIPWAWRCQTGNLLSVTFFCWLGVLPLMDCLINIYTYTEALLNVLSIMIHGCLVLTKSNRWFPVAAMIGEQQQLLVIRAMGRLHQWDPLLSSTYNYDYPLANQAGSQKWPYLQLNQLWVARNIQLCSQHRLIHNQQQLGYPAGNHWVQLGHQLGSPGANNVYSLMGSMMVNICG